MNIIHKNLTVSELFNVYLMWWINYMKMLNFIWFTCYLMRSVFYCNVFIRLTYTWHIFSCNSNKNLNNCIHFAFRIFGIHLCRSMCQKFKQCTIICIVQGDTSLYANILGGNCLADFKKKSSCKYGPKFFFWYFILMVFVDQFSGQF